MKLYCKINNRGDINGKLKKSKSSGFHSKVTTRIKDKEKAFLDI